MGCHCLLHNEGERGELKAGLKLNIQKKRPWHPVSSLNGKCCSVTKSRLILCVLSDCSTPGFPIIFHCLLEFVRTHVHRVGDAIQPSHHLMPSSPAFNLSQHQGLFQLIGSLHQVDKVLELQLHWSSPSNKYSGLISFKIDWFDLLAVQGTHQSLIQHDSSKASILLCSTFFMVQLSHHR